MITLCCPVTMFPRTLAALGMNIPSAVIVPVQPENITGQWDEIRKRWGGEDLLLIDHDVVVHARVIPEFTECPEVWCMFPYPRPEAPETLQDRATGCTRFRTEFMQCVSVEDVERQYGSCNACRGAVPGCWRHIDGRINDAAAEAGFAAPHLHWPPVGHRDMEWNP